MTEFKTVLVPVPDGTSAVAPLETAFRLAALFGAHVVGLHVRSDPTTAVPLVGEGMSGAMVEEMMNVAERQASERAGKARAAFDAAVARAGVALAGAPTEDASAEWVDFTGREEEAVAWRGRLSDLVVMGRPTEGAETPSLLTLNAALMESGKPLLLAPPMALPTIGSRIAVAWNGSAEAGRAVAAALPLMKRAESVTILSLTEDDRTLSAPAGELAAFLAWHGITANCQVVHAGAHAGNVLLDQCAALKADLLVMGAYTHSRLRQLILGGVTRHVLNHATLPCLLCH
ncbi:MAG TPA: universal stress protein [Magnetospirillum sp.]|jgi:nucleotide-binding universal stress UspA family protein|nr:universal stress protein [Magnetospirillum sp.]